MSLRPAASALLALAFLGAKCTDAKPYNGAVVDDPKEAPALVLADSAGGRFDLASQHGKVVLLFFGYTRCPDVCPTTLADWQRVRTALGNRADKVRFVFISVDRERDSPADVQKYVDKFDGHFIGLTGDGAELVALQQRYGITSQPVDPTAGTPMDPSHMTHDTPYAVAHSTQTIVVDRKGRVRLLFGVGAAPSAIAEDLRRLAGEGA